MKAQNIFLDENTGGKGRYFKSRFLQPGLVKYSFGVCLLEKETIDKFIHQFVGCPVIIGHNDVTHENADELSCGNICHIWYDEKDGWYWGDGIIDKEDALSKIESGYNVSCQYEITEYSNNTTGALHNGNPYDKVILNGKPEHLAIVETPRYENAMIAVNAIDKTAGSFLKGKFMQAKNDKWITKYDKEGDPYHVNIDKDYINAYDKMHPNWHYDKYLEYTDMVKKIQHRLKSDEDLTEPQMQDLKIKLEEYQKRISWHKSKTNKTYKWKDGDYSLEELVSKGFTPIKYSVSLWDKSDNPQLTYLEKEENKKYYKIPISLDDYNKLEKQYNERLNKEFQNIDYGKMPSYFYGNDPYKIQKNKARNVITQAINELKENDMFNNLFKKKEKKMEKDEIKSIMMECIQDVLKAQNEGDADKDKKDDKEEIKDAENKCKNGDVDKRELIRKIAAIAGKEEDSEDVRTIIKLAEQLGYNKSEAGTADNCGKKGKNEEEEREKEKEEAKNKAKNSIEVLKGLLSSVEVEKPQSKYITKAQAIELGDQLF